MTHLLNRNGIYYYNRKVPNAYRQYDPRDYVRVSLNTDSKKIAIRLADEKNDQLEAYWHTLHKTGEMHSESKYKALVERAQVLGFAYYYNQFLAERPFHEIIARYQYLEKVNFNEKQVEAVLGAEEKPVIQLKNALRLFWNLSKDKLIDKSERQVKKWKNPRKRAFKNFLLCVGNKPLPELTRSDIVNFRNWWIGRLKSGEYVSNTANKELINVKTIITTVAEHYELGLDDIRLFKKIQIKRDDAGKRPAFTTEYLLETFLKPENLAGLNEQARNALYAFSETGAGISELVSLLPEDIRLDDEIPHIVIVSRKGSTQKTKYRRREIPLVGFALDAFKECPDGFTRYAGRPDSLTTLLNKYLTENKLFPTEEHSVYSLRHSFQDRLLAIKALDREQADLMGHKFERPDYGEGVTLAQKLECLKKIQLRR
ncbi:hypothetical protein A3860_02395 [Niastella vici]|uniref:Tyr recombinase domain-containing protein n=1 Tax=Niastella vici TaxID=1703345 RepID=A0A1V9G9A1_9BACT|nr:site-specific integrase [Niastella vici]OQP67229.1 hypothetical protein A3860_02395 [Niastella vici]